MATTTPKPPEAGKPGRFNLTPAKVRAPVAEAKAPEVASEAPPPGVISEAPPPETPLVETPSFAGADLVPAFWIISPNGDGISARNGNTGTTFEGSVSEFNERLRG
jgi:hypothetical protein